MMRQYYKGNRVGDCYFIIKWPENKNGTNLIICKEKVDKLYTNLIAGCKGKRTSNQPQRNTTHVPGKDLISLI